MNYPTLQAIQVAVAVSLIVFSRFRLARVQRTLWDAPFLLVCLGYAVICPLSNLSRWWRADRTALWVISLTDCESATIWWIASLLLTTLVYLAVSGRRQGVGVPQGSPEVLRERTKRVYLGVFLGMCAALVLNPFAGKQFGVLTARSVSDLSVGGLLVAGIIRSVLSAVAVPILFGSITIGGAAVGIAVYLMSVSGSKGIAVVYFVYVIFLLLRRGGHARRFRHPLLATILLGALILVTPALLVISNRVRSGDSTLGFKEALMPTLSRFTQQDVASVIVSADEWRRSFRGTYVEGNVLAFIPGFIFPEKPVNPAYEINRLYGGPFSAASASLYGAVLIASSPFVYWVLLVLAVYFCARMDRTFFSAEGQAIHSHYEWYLLFTWAMLFEGDFVLAAVQMGILLAWRKWLLGALSRAREVKEDADVLLNSDAHNSSPV